MNVKAACKVHRVNLAISTIQTLGEETVVYVAPCQKCLDAADRKAYVEGYDARAGY
jgi:hypothetical protein